MTTYRDYLDRQGVPRGPWCTREEWRPIPGYEGRYEASNLGQIRSLPRTEIDRRGRPHPIAGGLLKRSMTADGYLHVSLRKNGRLRLVTVHRLIAEVFVPGRTAVNCEAAHLDNNRANPTATNLKWVSRAENIAHKFIHGTNPAGERHPGCKLTDKQVLSIFSDTRTRKIVAAEHGISVHTVTDIRTRRRWHHLLPKHESPGAGTAIAQNVIPLKPHRKSHDG